MRKINRIYGAIAPDGFDWQMGKTPQQIADTKTISLNRGDGQFMHPFAFDFEQYSVEVATFAHRLTEFDQIRRGCTR